MKSMTGFGQAESQNENWQMRIEIATVNRKQIDLALQIPRHLQPLESKIRKALCEKISRGRVNLSLKLSALKPSAQKIQLNLENARAIENQFLQLSKTLGREVLPTATDFLSSPDVFELEEQSHPEEVWPLLKTTLEQALENLTQSRLIEGQALKNDFEQRLNTLTQLITQTRERAPFVKEYYHQQLSQRLEEAEFNFDDERILKEVALYADRIDISEELTRLDAHISRFQELMDGETPSGRPLDFLCQEINREFNTIGSKANDAEIATSIVFSKTELEKIREQVQNIE